jgi:hypothetical protein
MKTNSSKPKAGGQVILDSAAKRQLVQDALDRFVAGQADDSDYDLFRDRGVMIASTAEQACRFLEVAKGRTVPFDIWVLWADVLRQRWYQAQSGRRSGSLLSRELVEVPAASLGSEDEQR